MRPSRTAQPGPSNSNPSQLLDAARHGAPSVVAEFLDTFRNFLMSVARQELSPALRSKLGESDLVQDSLIEACNGFDRFAGGDDAALRAWLCQILRNNIRDAVRAVGTAKRDVSREQPLEAENSDGVGHVEPIAADFTPCSRAAANEEEHRLDASMQRLPAHYRDVIRWRNLELRSFVDIGRDLGVSADSARKLWERAINRLAKELGQSHGRP